MHWTNATCGVLLVVLVLLLLLQVDASRFSIRNEPQLHWHRFEAKSHSHRLPFLGRTRLIGQFALHPPSSTSQSTTFNLLLSFNDLRFFLFCCANYGSGSLDSSSRQDSPNCMRTSAICIKYTSESLRCPVSDNVFQYGSCTQREIAEHIHSIETYEKQWRRPSDEDLSTRIRNHRSSVWANMVTTEGNFVLTAPLSSNSSHHNQNFTLSNMEIAFSDSMYFNGTDGMLGLGFSFLNASWNAVLNQTDSARLMWAIDLKPAPSNRSFLLAGQSDIFDYIDHELHRSHSNIQWSDTMHTVNDMLLSDFRRNREFEQEFPLYSTVYDITFCKAHFLANYSSHWPLKVNTHIEGVALPEPFYRMLFQWLKVDEDSIYTRNWTASTDLPSLELHITSQGQPLRIPLADLIDLDHNGTLHVYKSEMIYTYSGINVNSVYPPIEVGTRFLERYMVIVEMGKQKRVGFLEKAPSDTGGGSSYCKEERTCHPLQTYYEGTNSCIEPACFFYGQIVNTETHLCEVRAELYIILAFVLVALLGVECCVIQCHRRIAEPLHKHNTNLVIHS